MKYNLSFESIAIIILVILIYVFGRKNRTATNSYKLYYIMAGAILVAAVFNFASALMGEYSELFSVRSLYAINGFYLITQSLITPIFTVYVIYLANISINTRKKRLMLALPYSTVLVLIVTSPLNKLIYYISEEKSYTHGKFFPILYLPVFLYFVWCIVIAIKYRNSLGKNKITSILSFVVIIITAQIIQMFFTHILLVSFASALCMIIIMYRVQNPDEVFDKSNSMRKNVFLDIAKSYYTSGNRFSIISVHIHDAKLLYSSFGEEDTNALFRVMTSYLKSFCRNSIVFRANTETFMVKLDLQDDKKVEEILRKIKERFEHKWQTSDVSAYLSANFGLIKCPDNAVNISELIDAVTFMCENKSDVGTITYVDAFENLKRNREILNAVKRAVLNRSFQVYYQPIYSVEKKRIAAAEALVRLCDEKLGFISPEIFIPIAEKEGYILRIGKFVFEKVCSFYADNHLSERGIDYIEVNLSAVQCMQYRLADEFIEIMKEKGIKPSQINFEITETSAINSGRILDRNINIFSNYGITLSLDDYGTGYSNISYISNIPFEYIKVDKCILWSAEDNEKALITLKNTVKMAKKLHMKLVMEGVETAEQVKMLKELGCEYFQGYFFSKAVCDMEFIQYLKSFKLPKACE